MKKTESQVQQEIMIEAAKHGITLTRNNVGAGQYIDENTGNTSYVRFGLFNESRDKNRKMKSSDLFGLWPGVSHRWVDGPNGRAYFWSAVPIFIEVKKEGWVFNPKNKREIAQRNFIEFVKEKGAVAGFCQSVGDFLRLIGK